MWTKIKQQWRPLHPVWKAVLIVGLTTPITLGIQVGHQISKDVDPIEHARNAVTHYRINYLSDVDGVIAFVIEAPFWEELQCRIPPWIALLLLLGITHLTMQDMNKRRWVRFIGIGCIWIFIIILAIRWAIPHDFPPTVFSYGIIWAWVMMETRNPLYALLFHAASNGIASLGIWLNLFSFLF